MKLLIDTNIVLDVLLKREPFCTDAIKVLNLAGRPDIEEYVSASVITGIFYVAYRMIRDKAVVRSLINQLLKIVSAAEPDCREIGCRIEDKYKEQKTGNSRAARESAIVYSGSPAVFVCNTMVCKKNDRLKCDIRHWNCWTVIFLA